MGCAGRPGRQGRRALPPRGRRARAAPPPPPLHRPRRARRRRAAAGGAGVRWVWKVTRTASPLRGSAAVAPRTVPRLLN
eukprot:gene18328-biopygen20439